MDAKSICCFKIPDEQKKYEKDGWKKMFSEIATQDKSSSLPLIFELKPIDNNIRRAVFDENRMIEFRKLKENLGMKFHNTKGPALIFSSGDIFYYVDDKIHRHDGPAVIYSNGDKYFYHNDKMYAIEWINGSKSFYRDDRLHNLFGYAYIDENGIGTWYIYGIKITASVIIRVLTMYIFCGVFGGLIGIMLRGYLNY